MKESEVINIQAKTLEQAIVKAAGTLGAAQDEVSYEVLKQPEKKGLFGMFKTSQVEIKAWLKNGKAETNSKSNSRNTRNTTESTRQRAEPVERTPISESQVQELISELKGFCEGICEHVVGEKVEVKTQTLEDRLVLDIQSEEMAKIITKNTKLAEAMEHLLRKKPRHLKQELPFRVFVDVSGIRMNREDDLIKMAVDLSAKVSENKRPIVLNYKSSYDRKIIHMALDKDERVYTKSIGSGPNRKLMILPTKGEAEDYTNA